MFSLLKKDLVACFKIDLKTIIKVLAGMFLISIILMPSVLTPYSAVTMTFFISYIFIFRSFYLDELNKCDYFLNSLPIEKEDIVYSKYLFAVFVIIISLLFSYCYSIVAENIWGYANFDMDIVLMILILILILISISFPLNFKYGYRKSYIILNLIIAAIVVFGIYGGSSVQSYIIGEWEEVPILRDKTLIIKFILSIIMYLISMYISKKIYDKKEIAG